MSIILTIFAVREAEREKLIRERELEEQQQRSAQLIIDQVKAFIAEVEGRIIRLIRENQIQAHGKELTEVCRRIAEGEEIITAIFLIDEQGEVIFPLSKPLFLIPGEVRNIKERPIKIEPHPLLKTAEMAEFKTKDYPLAIKSYQKLMDETSDKDRQALILNYIGRCYQKSGKPLKAIEAYQKILKGPENKLSADGIPLGIIALYQIGSILCKTDRKIEGAEAFFELYKGLLESRWPLNKSQFHFYQDKVKAVLETAMAGIDEEGRRGRLIKKREDLRLLEDERLRRMSSKENLLRKVIPLIKTRKLTSRVTPEKFDSLSETIGEEFYLVLYTPLAENSVFGLRIDYEVLARKLRPLKLETLPLRKDWHVQIKDKLGKTVAGEEITHLKDPIPQLSYSKGFENDFPPWEVNIYQRNPGLAERQFNTRRNIYILSVVVVISALLLGGYLAIRSTAKELEVARLKSEFVSTVSHEFRTPLTSIRYLAELLKRGRVKEDDKKQMYYETITDESGRLSRLIENILDFSKIEAGMKEYQFRETDVTELTRDVASRFQDQAAPKGFTIESEISNQMPKIVADSEALSQALFNLLDNALKYSRKSLKALLRAWPDGDYVFLEVQDEGIGISKEEQKRVFEKFYRSDNVDESSIKGSGIGLTLVSHIVKAHGGEVLLESEVGRGTKVTIKLPLKRKKDKNE